MDKVELSIFSIPCEHVFIPSVWRTSKWKKGELEYEEKILSEVLCEKCFEKHDVSY